MKKIIPITDLQRQSAQIVSSLAQSNEPIIITQRGRAAAVLLSAEAFAQIEEDLNRLDELEMFHLLQKGIDDFAQGRTLSQQEVRSRLEQKQTETESVAKKSKTRRR
ncbi:MAG TPA: type II toxin-antitoxin system Phd/YefM family antitoxin [Acidobacteriota bacterium]|nr:type II toxin-antitoxin system Phd/YefM family antitoxin [Acidobacteriota bacterium]